MTSPRKDDIVEIQVTDTTRGESFARWNGLRGKVLENPKPAEKMTWIQLLPDFTRPDKYGTIPFYWPTEDLKVIKQPSAADIDTLVKDYAAVLQDIYDRRTAGDFTFSGVLAEFLWAIENKKDS